MDVQTARTKKELDLFYLTTAFYYKLATQKETYVKRLQAAKAIGDYSLVAKMQERIRGLDKAKKLYKAAKNFVKDEYYKKIK